MRELGRVIAVLSGKGGVGKTFFSANVSAALSDLGRKTLVIDFDVGLRNLDLALGMQDSTPFDFTDVLNGTATLESAITVHPLHKNLCFLGGPQFSEISELSDDSLEKLTQAVRESFDYIIVDCAAGIGRGFTLAAKAADSVILVATPENSSVRDSERTCSILREKGMNDIYLVVNRVRPKEIKRAELNNIDEIIDTVNVRLLGLIPEDVKTSVRANRGELTLDCKKAKMQATAIRNVAKRITGVETPLFRFWK